jgi:hypothetical protein
MGLSGEGGIREPGSEPPAVAEPEVVLQQRMERRNGGVEPSDPNASLDGGEGRPFFAFDFDQSRDRPG